MPIIKMRRTGRLLNVTERKAGLFIRMGAAVPWDLPVVKRPLPVEPVEVEPESKPEPRRTTRRYRRRDMAAEEA